jgi:hypothetical protein
MNHNLVSEEGKEENANITRRAALCPVAVDVFVVRFYAF